MTPTNKLRFVEREVPAPEHGPNITKAIRVLQRWWQEAQPNPLTDLT